jgi:hypothetical protein
MIAFVLYGMNFYLNHLMYFMLPEKYSYFIKYKLSSFSCFSRFFILPSPAFRKFLEINRRFVLKFDSEFRDSFIGSN